MGTTGGRSAAAIAAEAAPAPQDDQEEEERARTINDFEDRKSISAALRKLSMRASQCSTHSCPLYDSELSDTSSDDENENNDNGNHEHDADGADDGSRSRKDLPPARDADWITENMFMETSLQQSVAHETDRLMVLKSYLILDSVREPAFERLTGLAQRVFDVPIALVSLIDIGRQWFMSNRGLGDVRETPRKVAFCAHAIQSAEDLLVVPNTLDDPRFRNNGLVTGAPHIRFYAGAPLICPEGYKLGTLCIIDTKTRPDGLGLMEKQNLKELAALVMEAMVNRRKERMALAADRSKVMACMARDLMTPLESTRKTLSQMAESSKQSDAKNPPDAGACIQSALTSLSIMDKICTETIDNFRSDLADITNEKRSATSAGRGVLPMPSIDEEDDEGAEDAGGDDARPGLTRSASVASFTTLNSGGASSSRLHTVVLADFVDTLRTAVAQACSSDGTSHPPIEIVADPTVPDEFLSDELKLFRSALHLLMNAARHTPAATNGATAESYIRMRIYVKKMGHGRSMLMLECRDTGTGVDSEQRQKLYSPFSMDLDNDNAALANHHRPGLGLYSVAINVSSLGGRYGYRPRAKESWDATAQDTGSIFWFAVPLSVSYSPEEEPSTTGKAKEDAPSSPKAPESSPSNSEKPKMISVQDSDKYDAKEVYDAISRAMEDSTAAATGATSAAAIGEESLVPIRGSGSDSGSKRALVIDDSIVIRKSIGRALTNLGFQVTYASDGMQGLQALQSAKFDVVFCDFLMPVLDGLDCIEQYRTWEGKHRPDFHQKIVGLSAHAGEEDINRGKKAGMDTFVSKNSKLKDMLNRAITLSETFSSDKPSRSGGSSLAGSTNSSGPVQSAAAASSSAVPPSPLDTPMNRLATHPAYSSLMLRRSGIAAAGGGGGGGGLGKSAGVLNSVSTMNAFTNQTGGGGDASGGCPIGAAAALLERRQRSAAEERPSMECIICEDSRSTARALAKAATASGWTPHVAEDAEHALSMLKTKRWGAALIEEGEADGELSSAKLISTFREWEASHRTVKQNNLFAVSNSRTNDGCCPPGFNGAVFRPIKEADVVSLLQKASTRRSDREEIQR